MLSTSELLTISLGETVIGGKIYGSTPRGRFFSRRFRALASLYECEIKHFRGSLRTGLSLTISPFQPTSTLRERLAGCFLGVGQHRLIGFGVKLLLDNKRLAVNEHRDCPGILD